MEADTVFILEPEKLKLRRGSPWQQKQCQNLEYVAYTRSKHRMALVVDPMNFDGSFESLDDEE